MIQALGKEFLALAKRFQSYDPHTLAGCSTSELQETSIQEKEVDAKNGCKDREIHVESYGSHGSTVNVKNEKYIWTLIFNRFCNCLVARFEMTQSSEMVPGETTGFQLGYVWLIYGQW